MENSNPELTIVMMWIGARVSGLVILILMIIWAACNGQLKDMKRGRYLALDKDKKQEINNT